MIWLLIVSVCFLGKCQYFAESYEFNNISACIIAGSFNKQILQRKSIDVIIKMAVKGKWTITVFNAVVSDLKITYQCPKAKRV